MPLLGNYTKFFKSLLIFIILTVLANCSGKPALLSSDLSKYTSNSHSIALYLPLEYFLSSTSTDIYIMFAEDLLNHKLRLHEAFRENPVYDIENINWDIQFGLSPNTYSLYLHSLYPTFYLSYAYLQTGEEKYLHSALKIAKSWFNYDDNQLIKNRYAWYDHTVANRTEILLYLTIILEQQNQNTDLYRNKIIQHADWLMNDKNYFFNHNHGIFQDFALIKAGYYLNAEEYKEHGIRRLKKQFEYAYPHKHVHIENSAGYGIGMVSILTTIRQYLNFMNNDYVLDLDEYINNAIEFFVYAYMPNLHLPLYGDSLGYTDQRSSINDFGSPVLKYIATKGEEGVKPQEISKLFKEDGYFFIRNTFEPEDYDNATWLMFKSGFSGITHKHKDDLSIVLYAKGKEIFIDPGMYNYMVGDPVHDYTNSVKAHTTVYVDDKDYPIGSNILKRAGLLNHKKHEDYESVTGYNNLYYGVEIDRTVNYINENTFLIFDEIQADEEHLYIQNFHLGDDITVIELDKNHTLLKINQTEWNVMLQQIYEIDEIESITGRSSNDQISLRSRGMNTIQDTTTLRFKKAAQNCQFLTLISLVHDNDLKLVKSPLIQNDQVILDNITIDISPRRRIPLSNLTTSFSNSTVTLINQAITPEDKIGSSFYLLQKDSLQKYDAVNNTLRTNVSFKLEKDQEYAVMYYAKNKYNEQKQELTGFIQIDDNGNFYFDPKIESERTPHILNKTINQLNNIMFVSSL